MSIEQVLFLVIGGAFLLFVFLVCRELVCWYFKINDMVKLLDQQLAALQAIYDTLKMAQPDNEPQPLPPSPAPQPRRSPLTGR